MTPREFAIKVARQLQQAGYHGLWAGGCVRDQLLGREPKDYDVATDALPDQVRDLFGHRRTLAIGAAFGVITVLGPKSAGQIEVATFRRDADYSDGRRPDSVEFTNAEEDASRRDFTINGLFYDPVQEQVVDYVDGRQDIERQIVRAIGDPHERIREDKLRMLRGIRFASTLNFELDAATQAAIAAHAAEITAVSQERIGHELIRMLAHENRGTALQLMWDTGLLLQILPAECRDHYNEAHFTQRLAVVSRLVGGFESATAALLGDCLDRLPTGGLWQAWRLSNEQQQAIDWMGQHWRTLSAADQKRWSEIQPLLIHASAPAALQLAMAELGEPSPGVLYCHQQLGLDEEALNPAPLIDGRDLQELGIKPGPEFSLLLNQVRAAQLDGEIANKQDAVTLVKNLM